MTDANEAENARQVRPAAGTPADRQPDVYDYDAWVDSYDAILANALGEAIRNEVPQDLRRGLYELGAYVETESTVAAWIVDDSMRRPTSTENLRCSWGDQLTISLSLTVGPEATRLEVIADGVAAARTRLSVEVVGEDQTFTLGLVDGTAHLRPPIRQSPFRIVASLDDQTLSTDWIR